MSNDQSDRSRTLGMVQVVILGVINNHPGKAYGTAITGEVAHVMGRPDLTEAQIYVALRRLEDYGAIESRLEEMPMPSKRSRGRPRKYYALTASGRRALEGAGEITSSIKPFMRSTTRGEHEGETKVPAPTPVVV